MPKCQSCAANYGDNFRYCPYCGTAKPNPQIVVVQGADSRLYEEGALRLKCVLEKQVIGTYKPWLGRTKVEQQPVSTSQIELVALSHEKGEYVALKSATFRQLMPLNREQHIPRYLAGYTSKELELHLKNAHDYVEVGYEYDRGSNEYFNMQQTYFEALYRELKSAWEGFCASLKNDGWFGVTEEAIRRTPPVGILGDYPSRLHDDIEPKDPYKEPFYNYGYTRKRYRYRRQT